MAAMPISLNEQQRHPLGSDSSAVVREFESGSDRVNDLADLSANSVGVMGMRYLQYRSYRQSLLNQHCTFIRRQRPTIHADCDLVPMIRSQDISAIKSAVVRSQADPSPL
jgi:hypothetical protein